MMNRFQTLHSISTYSAPYSTAAAEAVAEAEKLRAALAETQGNFEAGPYTLLFFHLLNFLSRLSPQLSPGVAGCRRLTQNPLKLSHIV